MDQHHRSHGISLADLDARKSQIRLGSRRFEDDQILAQDSFLAPFALTGPLHCATSGNGSEVPRFAG